MQDRLMAETMAEINEADVQRAERAGREAELEAAAERFAKLTRPIGESPHEPPHRRKRRR